MTRFITFILPALAVTACAPTTHEIGYASENTIEIKYSAYGMTPTLTAEATDIAVKHCEQHGKFANYQGASVPNILGTGEVHTFACEKVKRDDAAVIQADRGSYTAATNTLVNSIDTITPKQTVCNNTATGTICTTY